MEKSRKYYENLIKSEKDYKQYTLNFLQSFLGGGIICIIGQAIYDFYYNVFNFSKDDSSLFMTLTVILLSGLITGLGLYDNLGQVFKSGSSIPVSGFANAACSAAMEYHKEGIILGIGSNTLKLAGSVIVLGSVSAVIVAGIRYLFMVIL